jgi:hypothetical protein
MRRDSNLPKWTGNSATRSVVFAIGWIGSMQADGRQAAGLLLGLVIAWGGAVIMVPPAVAATRHGPAATKTKPANGPATEGAATRTAANRHRPTFRPTRAAAQEAKQLGAAVGNGCNGKADIQRNDHEWVVLCSNGKTYVIETPSGPRTGAPATECSLAGIGPAPACFNE